MTWFNFGQKVIAKRFEHSDFENALAVLGEDGDVFVVWPDCEAKWVRREWVKTKADVWREKNREKILAYQRQWQAKRAAEKAGISLEEYVYKLEAKRAKRAAKKDPAETRRRYWRDRQRAHRKKKVETDGE